MSDFINKIVMIALIFIMLVLSPLLISYKIDDAVAKRTILNEVSQFIDKVKHTAIVTEEDLNKLYIACNASGLSVDVKVKRLVRADINKDGKIETVHYAVDDLDGLEDINYGDVIKVTVTEIGISTSRRLMYNILRIDEGKFEFSLAGTVG